MGIAIVFLILGMGLSASGMFFYFFQVANIYLQSSLAIVGHLISIGAIIAIGVMLYRNREDKISSHRTY